LPAQPIRNGRIERVNVHVALSGGITKRPFIRTKINRRTRQAGVFFPAVLQSVAGTAVLSARPLCWGQLSGLEFAQLAVAKATSCVGSAVGKAPHFAPDGGAAA
jgi:hypothetical protein